jgi:hypothetical protein
MRGRAAGRLLKNSVLKGAAGNGAAVAMTRGVQAAGQVGATATEFLRVRRDPAEIARRRRQAAVRRIKIWSAGVVVGVASGGALAVSAAADGLATSMIFSMVLVAALVLWCLLGVFRSVADLRRRSREVAGIPPPQPSRRAVAPQIRPEIGRLDSYSDGLRRLAELLPAVADSGFAGLRHDVIASADVAEELLRRQAREYTQIRRAASAAPRPAQPTLLATADLLAQRIRSGVQEYGRLVAAATDTVAASAELSGVLADLRDPAERLSTLAMGMREIAQHAGEPGPAAPAV